MQNGGPRLSAGTSAKPWIGTVMKHPQGVLAKATSCLGCSRACLSFQSGLWVPGLVMFWEEKKNRSFSQSPIICRFHSHQHSIGVPPLGLCSHSTFRLPCPFPRLQPLHPQKSMPATSWKSPRTNLPYWPQLPLMGDLIDIKFCHQ